MEEIHGKSILVRVSARFELARVRVIEAGEAYKLYASLVLRMCVENICSCLKRV